MSFLEAEGVNSYYGDSHILFNVSLRVEKSEVVALLGRNGAGKSTTLKSLMGMVRARSGTIRLDGVEIQHQRPHKVAAAGLQLVPEERRIFGGLTVAENIELARLTASEAWPLARIYDMFPRLAQRKSNRGNELSGGEQQMLAIARALVRQPKVLLLDEPFEGLAPIIVHDLLATCERIAAEGQTIVIVEQNLAAALKVAHRVYVLNNGHMVWDGSADALQASPEVMQRYLGV